MHLESVVSGVEWCGGEDGRVSAEWGSTVLTNEVSLRGEVKGRTKGDSVK